MSTFRKKHGDLLEAGRREVAPAALRERLFTLPAPLVAPAIVPSRRASFFGSALVVGVALVLVSLGSKLAAPSEDRGPSPVSTTDSPDGIGEVVRPAMALPSSSVAAPPTPTPSALAEPAVSVVAKATPPNAGVPVRGLVATPLGATSGHERSENSAPGKGSMQDAPVPTVGGAGEDVGTLGAEAALLGTAKRALAGGDVVSADSALASYGRRFPTGALGEEEEALRIERAIRFGDRESAAKSLTAFESRHPRSPAVTRLRHMLSR